MTSEDDRKDDAEAGFELHHFGAGRQPGLDIPGPVVFAGKGVLLIEDISIGHQREGPSTSKDTGWLDDHADGRGVGSRERDRKSVV